MRRAVAASRAHFSPHLTQDSQRAEDLAGAAGANALAEEIRTKEKTFIVVVVGKIAKMWESQR